jgi:hypothetical protein
LPSTGTTSFNPSAGDLGFYALRRCGIQRTAVDASHLADLAMAGNLVLSDLSTEQPNLWKVALISTPLTQGVAQYTLPANVLVVLNCYRRTVIGGTTNNDIDLYGVSRDEYSSYPNKALQQPPSVYWADRVVPIVLNLYPTPDANGPYTIFIYCIQQDDDVSAGAGDTIDMPYRFLKAFSDGLCKELALTYAPDRVQGLTLEYEASKKRAQVQDRENVTMSITPGLSRYYQTNG